MWYMYNKKTKKHGDQVPSLNPIAFSSILVSSNCKNSVKENAFVASAHASYVCMHIAARPQTMSMSRQILMNTSM